jgi:hypothetical protein
MAVDAQQLPVASVGGIVVVVVIAMMHGQLTQFFPFKLTATAPAHMRIHFQSLLAITSLAFLRRAPCFCDKRTRFPAFIHILILRLILCFHR